MTATSPGFVGARLAQARKARGLTAVSLAEILGITSASISQYEHDKQAPRPELTERLAVQLNVPPTFFLREVTPDTHERATKWRSNTTATKFARERAEIRYEWLREIVEYLGSFLNFPALNIPVFDGVPDDFRELSHADIDRAAKVCREHWGLGTGPIPDLVVLLESNGVIVSRGRLNAEGLDAFSEWLPNDLPYVFLGSDINVGVRSRFDTAHELGHLVMHRHVSKKQFGKPEDFKILERQAHRFAAAFLLPKEQFFRELWAPTLDAFASLKPRWKTSIKGMIVHSHRHGLLSDTQYQRAMINYNRRWKDGEPSDDQIVPEQPRFLARCMEMILEESVQTRDQVLAELPFAQFDIEELIGLPRGFLSGANAEVIPLERPTFKVQTGERGGKVVSVDFSPRRGS
ncbi:XRE family transcriptional regulator [Polaromonas sp.]|uniref:helix-turn-helix domain-containing protein n=1 Tax=Polaromonas sp. TaxID=1869339 RepID=UPI00326464A1